MTDMLERLREWISAIHASRKRQGALLFALLILGLLLWARLIVVSDLPRMAIAEKEAITESDNSPPATSQQSP